MNTLEKLKLCIPYYNFEVHGNNLLASWESQSNHVCMTIIPLSVVESLPLNALLKEISREITRIWMLSVFEGFGLWPV